MSRNQLEISWKICEYSVKRPVEIFPPCQASMTGKRGIHSFVFFLLNVILFCPPLVQHVEVEMSSAIWAVPTQTSNISRRVWLPRLSRRSIGTSSACAQLTIAPGSPPPTSPASAMRISGGLQSIVSCNIRMQYEGLCTKSA